MWLLAPRLLPMIDLRHRHLLTIWVLLVAVSHTPIALSAADEGIAGEGVRPPEVYVELNVFDQDLDLLRLALGKPKASEVNITLVEGVAPRHVFFQAMTLCAKASHLRFEWTRSMGVCPDFKLGPIEPVDVLAQIRAASEQLQILKQHFSVSSNAIKPKPDPTHTPTDVFRQVLKSNRQLNILLRSRYEPRDVFREVTLAVYYAAELLAKFPEINQRIPSEPDWAGQKTSADVYLRLEECVVLIRQINQRSGARFLSFSVDEDMLGRVGPSDVYDVAALLVSELSNIYWRSGRTDVIRSYEPPHKIPSDVFQRSGILLKQLTLLLEQIESRPDWLDAGSR